MDISNMADEWQSLDQRIEQGRASREAAPHDSHGDWIPALDRQDPVALIEGQNTDRIDWLLPVRRVRMAASPFAFYRGAARIMAHDLAQTPVSGLQTQICGDAHLGNFGGYASPERRLVFDINDFDETLPGPWEWDVKRLAASFVIAARHNGLSPKQARRITRHAVFTYRKAMNHFAQMRVTDVWYHLVSTEELLQDIEGKKKRKAVKAMIRKAKKKDSRHALAKLAQETDGEFRIRSDPPYLIPLRDLSERIQNYELEEAALKGLEEYRKSVPDHVDQMLSKFRLIDAAIKVVGVGSVGTHCYVMLLEGRDSGDPLFLQLKQATRSVLEEHLPHSQYELSGQRVVEGQRLMQTVSDIFLGWAKIPVGGNHFFVRQLKDWKSSVDLESASYDQLFAYGKTRGWTLARAHARTGDPIAISAYLGSEPHFDRGIATFAERYADQNEIDYQVFLAEIDSGRLDAGEYE
jgi:uncharacterized protein (DUF2252 family)